MRYNIEHIIAFYRHRMDTAKGYVTYTPSLGRWTDYRNVRDGHRNAVILSYERAVPA